MARINVESSFFSDPRFRLLVKELGDEDKAIGLCLRAWALAQKYWSDGEQLVPEKLWRSAGLEHLFGVDLAILRTDGVYVRGSADHFNWLLHEKRVAAGRRSAEVRKAKFGSAQPNKPEQNSNISNSPSPTPSPTPSLKESSKELSPPDSPPGGSGGSKWGEGDKALAERWAEHARTISPKLRIDVGKWADAIRLIRERDGLTIGEVEAVFEFVRQDEFWRPNAISPQAIRGRSKNGLTKLENIRVRMQQVGYSAGGKTSVDIWFEEHMAREGKA